jgi:hypothetical protein
MRGHRLQVVLILLLVVCFATAGSLAQTSLGGVKGIVTDQSSGVVPGAGVTLKNVDTNQTRTTVSNDVGLYAFPSVPAGNYSVIAEMAGFTKFEGKLVLRVGQEATVDIRLTVGSQAVEVTVADSTPVVETSTSTLYDIKESERIETLPLNGRSIATLFALTPGVSREAGTTQVNGLQQGNVQFLADGVSLEDKYLGDFTRVSPALEGVQEFKVEALNSSAQFSKPATISYLTKSGTNRIHGSALETYRSNGLLARNPFSTKPQSKLIRHEFGGSVGGPIILPKIYNGTDKTFFFFTYEGLRQNQRYSAFKGSPTEVLRNGDFSTYVPTGESTVYTIYDPLSTRLDAATGLYVRDPFPNNKIPANRISAMAKAALSRYPMPNIAGAPIEQNLEVRLPSGTNEDKFTVKGDHQTEKDTFTLTYTFVDQVRPSPKGGSPTTEIYYNTVTARTYQGTFANTHTFSPSVVNEFRLGFTRPNSRRGPTVKDPKITDLLNLPNVTGDSGWPCLYPLDPVSWDIEFGGWPGGIFWDDDNPQTAPQLYTTWIDNLSMIKGAHSLKMGGQFRTMAVNSDERGQPRGCYTFGPQWTGLGDENGNLIPLTGSGFASFLLGYDDWGELRSDKGFFYHRQKDLGVYFQDDWKVTRQLTLNLGIRYEYYSRYRDLRDQIATYDPTSGALVLNDPVEKAFSVNPAAVAAYRAAGVVFKTAAEAGLPSHLLEPDRNDFAPRIGFAYQLPGNRTMVLRGGWGINYWTLPLITLQAPTRQNPPFNFTRSQVGYPRDPADLYRVKPPYELGGSTPAFSDSEVFINAPVNISPFSPYMKDSIAQTWNLTLQQEVLPQTSLELSYVGTRGTDLQFMEPVNTAYPASLYPLVSTQNRRANPVFGNANTLKTGGWSQSHQFQAELMRNVSKGVTFQVFYVLAKTLNNSEQSTGSSGAVGILGDRQSGITSLDQRLELETGNSAYYPRHRFTFNFLIDLPFGPGQRFAGGSKGVLARIVEGWQIAAISTNRSGLFFSPDRNRWRVGDGNLPSNERTLARWFDTSAFVQAIDPDTGKVVDVITNQRPGRNILEGPGFSMIDFSVFKNTAITESVSLRFTADFFNVLNHPNYSNPNATSGRITSTASDPRLIQFGARLEF